MGGGGQLFVIEAPGKRATLKAVLRRLGYRNIEVLATRGHLAGNPANLHEHGIDESYRETAYGILTEKAQIAREISEASKIAQNIYLATDDDQEGDVIARDVWRFCIAPEDRGKVLRLRAKAMSESELKDALTHARPLDPQDAAKGDARRIMDRLIGALSGKEGVVGRVLGSSLRLLRDSRPVVGVATHVLTVDDGQDWIRCEPVRAGEPIPTVFQHHVSQMMSVSAQMRPLALRPKNHDDILLGASLRLHRPVSEISQAMQRLYEGGELSYPRGKDRALTPESLKRLNAIARMNGVGFSTQGWSALRDAGGLHAHEAPNPMVLGVPVNEDYSRLGLDQQVLAYITQQLLNCGVMARIEWGNLPSAQDAPLGMNTDWMRLTPLGRRLWPQEQIEAGFRPWTREQSLLHFMTENGLGRPSTIVAHITKIIERNLITRDCQLTNKGKVWEENFSRYFAEKNLSKVLEMYIESNNYSASDLVAGMIEVFNLDAVRESIQISAFEYNDESDEIPAGVIP